MTTPTTGDRTFTADEERAALRAMYPDNVDPMPDGFRQTPYYVEIMAILMNRYADYADVVVGGDLFVYYVEGDPNTKLAPDCFVVFGVDRDEVIDDNSYFVWRAGKVPDFVLEIGSESTANRDKTTKRDEYEAMGIPEYWLFDPTGGDHYGFSLAGHRLVNGVYEPIEMNHGVSYDTWGHSEVLGLTLCWDDGALRFYDPVPDQYLRSPAESEAAFVKSEAARQAAEDRVASERAARQAAEDSAASERAARQAAEAEIERLRNKFRRLRDDQ